MSLHFLRQPVQDPPGSVSRIRGHARTRYTKCSVCAQHRNQSIARITISGRINWHPVDFLNSDTVQHNAFWPAVNGDKKAAHNLGTWPKGEKRAFTFSKPGVVPIFCNVHPEMAAYMIVSPTPYFAETDDSGNYKIKDVPDGTYTLTTWHEGAKTQSKPLTVRGDSRADVTIGK
jgi:hypothetical protein